MKYFKTVREAAIVALRGAVVLSKIDNAEYGGFILRSKEGYAYTAPKSDGDSGNVDLNIDLRTLPRGTSVVSDYHTHPCRRMLGKPLGYFDKFFSGSDMQSTADYDNAYMASVCTGDVYESNPSLPVVYPNGPEYPSAALGPVIGNVFKS